MADQDNVRYIVSSSPHAHSGASVRRIMLDVIIALVPALVASVMIFGVRALWLTAACVLACLATEVLCRKAMNRDLGVGDLSAVVTGILLAFNLPPDLPIGMAVVGSIVAIAVAKQIFGGIGYNPFNPALVGRVMLLISFPVAMTRWSPWTIPAPLGIEAVTTATPLGLLKTTLNATGTMPYAFDGHTALQFFLGARNGCLGETSIVALLIGGLYLLYRRVITWHTPVFYLGTVALFAAILWTIDLLWIPGASKNMPPLFHLMSGGLVLGAFFMATDMVTTPITRRGQAIFGIGCGVLTMLIRQWGGYPEGVSFAILLMNGVTPLINKATRPRLFGKRPRTRRKPAA